MAAGFHRGEMRSKSGRIIQPTSKVRMMLVSSMCDAFEHALVTVQQGERRVRIMLAGSRKPAEVMEEMAAVRQDHQELRAVVEEQRSYLNDDEFDQYRQRCLGADRDCVKLEEDVEAYLAGASSSSPASEGKGKAAVSTLVQQTRALERELQSIGLELTRLGLAEEQARHDDPPSSTPRDVDTNPQGKHELNFSTAPSTVPLQSASHHRALGVVPTAPVMPAVPVDATAAALDRLAGILESRAESSKSAGKGRLPRVEPDTFKGDLLTFPAWWSAFEVMIEGNARTEQEKLFYLSKFTAGPAQESIRGFLSLYSDDTAYRKARNVIVSRYGNRLKIAEAFKTKLSKWSAIKDGDGTGLQSYADFLWQCHSAMDTLDYLSNLGCQEENVKLASKLPRLIGERWDRIVDDAVYGDEPDLTEEPSGLVGHYPSFHEFCRFVSREARIVTSTCTRPAESQSGGSRRRAAAFRSEVKEVAAEKALVTSTARPPAAGKSKADDSRVVTCGYCKGNHYLYKCQDFLNKNVEFKRDYAKQRGLCFGCLRNDHTYRDCRIKNPEIMRDHVQPGSEQDLIRAAAAAKATTMQTRAGEGDGVYSSMIVPVWCFVDENPEMKILVYALLDTQSSGCFITDRLASRLQTEPAPVRLELTTLGSRRNVACGVVQGLRVKGESEGESIALPRCYTRRNIPGDYGSIPAPEKVARWEHLQDVAQKLNPAREDVEFGLLIGFNCSEALCAEEYRRGRREQPFAMRTVLGWTVLGCLEQGSPKMQNCWSFRTEVREITSEQMSRAFDLSFAEEADDRKMSHDDALFTQIVDQGMTQNEDLHFQLPLPFRAVPEDLPDSRPLAFKRLMSVGRRMRKDPDFERGYAEFMDGLIGSGQAVRVALPDCVPIGRRWYWCHHAVTHPRKPGKFRGVWDGAAEVGGVSINSRLLTGPDQMNNLVGVLMRFRNEKVAVTCDVEGMFLQVRVDPAHQQYLRFLWFEDGDEDKAVVEYQLTVHPFGAASSPGCAGAALLETARRGKGKFGEEAARFVRDHFYVDDGLGSVEDDEKALSLIRSSRALCASGGFNLRKFACSSRAVMAAIEPELRVASMQSIQIQKEHLPNERTLGLLMSMENDAFLYCVQLAVRADNRRSYLSALSSVFDPMGLVSPALLPGRLLLQNICRQKFDWDEPVQDEIKEEWRLWYSQLVDLNELSIARCVRRTVQLPVVRREIHVFTDASTHGYGACCYLLLTDAAGHVNSTLMYAKSRVPPSKQTTVPRLELQAAVLGVKMSTFVAAELRMPGSSCHFWTDSTVVIGYITNESRRFHVYVANRSQYIRSCTRPEQWHHVATERNPADIASRGTSGKELVASELWWNGPVELMTNGLDPVKHEDVSGDDPELRRVTTVGLSTKIDEMRPATLLLSRCSSWLKCLGAAAMCFKFADILVAKIRGGESRLSTPTVYRARAERWFARSEQEGAFADELATLEGRGYPSNREAVRDRKDRLKPSSNLYRLDVYCDAEGLLRVGGRLGLSGWPREMVHPRVVSGRSLLAARLILYYHVRVGHMGAVTSLNAIRQGGWWLLSGRSEVSKQIATCVVCRRQRGTVVEQKMADLPPDRLDTSPAFTHVAADLFGPWKVRRGRAVEKWWICVFVCMASRAIHLEPVSSLDISGFIQAYRRFVARRGPVRTLRCDRGTNFTGASNEQMSAMKELDQDLLSEEMRKRSCDLIPFNFNYPKASHMAGSWERMIRTVRSAFWCTLSRHEASVALEVFLTLATEAEWLVNSRPLSVVDMSDDTTPVALTPAQLLTLKPEVLAPPPGRFSESDRYSRRRWRLTQHLADQFWRRWIREYALQQQRRRKWSHPRDNLRVDDIVLVVDENASRGSWSLAVVSEVDASSDGLVRKVTVRSGKSTLQRPVQKLVFLYRRLDANAESLRPSPSLGSQRAG